jgi:hypothetical protein
MDSHLYVDQYLRRRKGVAFPTSSVEQQQLSQAAHNAILAAAGLRRSASPPSAPAAPPPPLQPTVDANAINRSLNEHADVVQSLATHVQTFVDRTDALNLQVQSVEDKLLNLTKMVKVAQEVGDEQTQSLTELTDALRRRLEETNESEARTRSELDDFRRRVPQMLQDAVSQAVTAARADAKQEADALRATVGALEKQMLQQRTDILAAFTQQLEGFVGARLAHENEKTHATLREMQSKFDASLVAHQRDITKEMNDRRAQIDAELRTMSRSQRNDEHYVTADNVRRMMDDRVAQVVVQCRDTAQSDIRHAVLTVQTTVREESVKAVKDVGADVREVSNRVRNCEEQVANTEASFHEFIAAFKEHTNHQASKMEDTAGSMKELMELHDETRNLVATEIESTKQWATRNMLRLKKHLDNVNVDVGAIKDAHRDLHLVVERLKVAQNDEHLRLADLVSQRTKEADALANMVDREIASVQNIARAYRQSHGHGGNTVAAAVRRAASSGHGRDRNPRSSDAEERSRQSGTATEEEDTGRAVSADDEDVFERFAERAAVRRQKMRSLFNEMNFRERHTAPVTARDS